MGGIYYTRGNLLDAPNRVIAHGCNAQGVMGSGVAKAIRDKYPRAYSRYREAYEEYHDRGAAFLGTFNIAQISEKRAVANVITQNNYGRVQGLRYVSYDALEKGFRGLCEYIHEYETEQTFSVPLVGAGLANGSWAVISAILTDLALDFDIDVTVYLLPGEEAPRGVQA